MIDLTGSTVLISVTAVLVGILMLVIPFAVLLFFIKKFSKKEKDGQKEDLKLRLELLEKEVEEIKKHINYIDDI